MDLSDFKDSVSAGMIPADLSVPLQALWLEARGDWHQAHNSVQGASGPEAAWVHAYLHRKEGDVSNAAYWYRRAGRTPTKQTLEEEWATIAETLLQRTR
jgi:hypothetical protein